jgi:acyl-CoA reductase-like NAD-dependent aldehyde dehydrogenase
MISSSDQSPASPHRYPQFIAGEWADAAGGGTFEDFNPYDGSVFAQVPASTAVANATPYGLTAAILTEDTGAAVLLAGAIEAGVVNINGPTMYAEPILPIGGVKESGWGGFGRWSVENFTDRNLITVHHGKPPRTL